MGTPKYTHLDDTVAKVMDDLAHRLGITQRALIETSIMHFLNFFPAEIDQILDNDPKLEDKWVRLNQKMIRSDLFTQMKRNYETRIEDASTTSDPEMQEMPKDAGEH